MIIELDLREGFDLTSRLFFSTLEKYRIVKFEPEAGVKLDKDSMHVEAEKEAEKKEDKGKVAEVVERTLAKPPSSVNA